MTVTWQLTVDCAEPARMVRFWAAALGYVVQPPPEGFDSWNDWYRSVGVPEEELDTDGDSADRLMDPSGAGPAIWFQVVPEAKQVKNRLHLDVYPGGRTLPRQQRRADVDRKVEELLALGATVRQRPAPEDDPDRYAVGMLDPEGNEFCVS